MEVPEAAEAPVVPVVPVAPVIPVAPDVPPEVPARRRGRGRTTLLIATAAVLGLVAGTCVGYLVQADREPTKLPALSQPVLAQAEGEGPEPLSAAQDRKVKTDGDLRKLLLKRPGGAKDITSLAGEDGWLDIRAYADALTNSDEMFTQLVEEVLVAAE